MKSYSNIPFENSARWKDGELIVFIGQKDNGYLPTGDPMTDKSGMRYEADFTIVKGETMEDAIHAFTRMQADPVFDKKVIDNIEVEGRPAIETKPVYANKISASIFPALPVNGQLKKGQVYSYGNGAVMVVQDHIRTAFAPEVTPALFSFYREVTEGKEWIAGEQITINATRTYNGKTYKCIQAHQSQTSWNPELTLGTLWQVVVTTSAWTIGVAYKVNDIVTYLSKSYKCRQAHTSITTWNPVAAPSLWLLL